MEEKEGGRERERTVDRRENDEEKGGEREGGGGKNYE